MREVPAPWRVANTWEAGRGLWGALRVGTLWLPPKLKQRDSRFTGKRVCLNVASSNRKCRPRDRHMPVAQCERGKMAQARTPPPPRAASVSTAGAALFLPVGRGRGATAGGQRQHGRCRTLPAGRQGAPPPPQAASVSTAGAALFPLVGRERRRHCRRPASARPALRSSRRMAGSAAATTGGRHQHGQ